ncbi:zinc finger protein SNAI2-like [Uloborus diversus]|uniref:zinc finger protein SNAI2-like n=1 Tax=Uloborus diversus TaxID=327109 RepID=UPI002409C6C6|nr:zinc finger protein SNAI2-like [Uloborus diversus]
MPRAFLITNKRYNSAVDYEENRISREASPERVVSTAEGGPLFRSTSFDSEGDSIGFESLKPTSPHSPAHESRSLQQSPSVEEPTTLGLTVFRPLDHDSRLNATYSNISFSAPAQCGFFRPCQSNTSALVTVIRQLMQQPSSSPNRSSPDISNRSSPTSGQSDTHVCGECGKRYSTSSNLARHRQTHRSVTDKKARKCPHCEKVYVSMPAYSMHVRTHSQGCQCPYCGKCFSRPWLLQGHIRTHTGEKPFTCPVCRKAFADKSNLRAHIQTHSSSKPYVCGRCGKAFALKSYLYKHEESSCMRVHRQQHAKETALDLAPKAIDQKEYSSMILERNTAILVG